MNKKLLGFTLIAALMLSGCGNDNNNNDTPTPEPEPTPTTPTVDDLKARLTALGETVTGTLTIKAGVINNASDISLDVHQNSNYNILEGFGGIAKISVDTASAYYVVEETDTSFEADWGVYYTTEDNFKANELVTKFATTIEESSVIIPYKSAESVFNITDEDLCSDLCSRLGYSSILGVVAEKITVSITDTSKLTFTFYAKQTSSAVTAVAEVSSATDSSYAALDTWLSKQTEFPAAPYTATELLKTKFTDTKNFTRKYYYSGVGYENTYTTVNSQTIARDEGWLNSYAQYKYYHSLFNFNAQTGTDHISAVYRSFSYNSVDANTIKNWNDSDFEDSDGYGYAPYAYYPSTYQSVWVNPDFVNETLGYNFGEYITEAYTPYGQGFSVNPTLKLKDGTTLVQYYSRMFGDLVSEANHEKRYSGYDVESWDAFYFVPEYKDNATEQSVENVESIYVLCEFTGSYWDTEKSYEAGQYGGYATYTNFGTTVDKIGEALIARETAKEKAVEVKLSNNSVDLTTGVAFDVSTVASVVYTGDQTEADVYFDITVSDADKDKITIAEDGTTITVSEAGTYTITISANGGTAVTLTLVVTAAAS